MRLLQYFILRLNCLALIVIGAVAFKLDFTGMYELTAGIVPDYSSLRWALGALLIIIAAIGLIPWPESNKRKQKLVFKGAHGNVTIMLNSVEQAINRAAKKLPEVKRISAHISPSDSERNVSILADIILRKPANASARDLEAEISSFIAMQAKRILGDETAVSVDLNITDIIVEAVPVLKKKPGPEIFDGPSTEEEEIISETDFDGAELPDSSIEDGEDDSAEAEAGPEEAHDDESGYKVLPDTDETGQKADEDEKNSLW